MVVTPEVSKCVFTFRFVSKAHLHISVIFCVSKYTIGNIFHKMFCSVYRRVCFFKKNVLYLAAYLNSDEPIRMQLENTASVNPLTPEMSRKPF